MDRDIRRHIMLGFFILVGLTLFIVGIFLVGSKNEMFQKSFPITAKFTNAVGLKVGSNVRYNGVKVGIVKAIALINDTMVRVDMQIEESKRGFILSNAVATIASDGLMGDKLVNLAPGKDAGEPLRNNDLVASRKPLNTEEMMQTLSLSNDNIKVITENLKTLTTTINTGDGVAQSLYKDPEMATQLKQSFSNLDVTSGKLVKVTGTIQQIANQIQSGNGALGEVISDTNMARNLSTTFSQLKETSDELIRASANLNTTIAHANSGKGALNTLLTDTAFATNMQQSMTNLNKASVGLDQNMEAMKHNFLTRGYFRRLERKTRDSVKAAGR